MENSQLFYLIERLSYNSKCHVQHLVINLVGKARENAKDIGLDDPFKDCKFIMADDFDAPIKEFHDYTYSVSIELIEKIESLPLNKQTEVEDLVDSMLQKVKNSQV